MKSFPLATEKSIEFQHIQDFLPVLMQSFFVFELFLQPAHNKFLMLALLETFLVAEEGNVGSFQILFQWEKGKQNAFKT